MASEEIHELNLTYLMLAQRLLSYDRESGMLQLQLTEDIAEYLLSLSGSQLTRLARVNQCLFRLRINRPEQLQKLTREEREEGMLQTHAALLLASSLPLTA